MSTWTFRSHSGREITVEADDEPSARASAMSKLWGPAQPPICSYGPSPRYAPCYEGRGLLLVLA